MGKRNNCYFDGLSLLFNPGLGELAFWRPAGFCVMWTKRRPWRDHVCC